MNRLTFLKRLLGGVVAAPVVAKALVEEKAPLAVPFFPSIVDKAFPLMVSSYPVTTGNPYTDGVLPYGNYEVRWGKPINITSLKKKRRRKRK